MRTPQRMRGNLLAASVLLCLTGCAMVGARFLDSSWDEASTQLALGVHFPIVVAEFGFDQALAIPLEYVFSSGYADGGPASISEFGTGATFWPMGSPWGAASGDPLPYVGAGLSLVSAKLTSISGSDQDEDMALAGFLHAGVWFAQRDAVLGCELRYTFGGSLELGTRDLSAAGLQLMFVVAFKDMDLRNLSF